MTTFVAQDIVNMLEDPDLIAQVQVWLNRGDGIAVYENQDLGHRDMGDRRFLSFGSPLAQIETDEPPAQMPDFPGTLNWRYRLIGTYRDSRQLPDPREQSWATPDETFRLFLSMFQDVARNDKRKVVKYGWDVTDFNGIEMLEMHVHVVEPLDTTIRIEKWMERGKVDRLTAFEWIIEGDVTLSGSDPNYGGTLVSVANLSAGRTSKESK